jgi:hypothetical protein
VLDFLQPASPDGQAAEPLKIKNNLCTVFVPITVSVNKIIKTLDNIAAAY